MSQPVDPADQRLNRPDVDHAGGSTRADAIRDPGDPGDPGHSAAAGAAESTPPPRYADATPMGAPTGYDTDGGSAPGDHQPGPDPTAEVASDDPRPGTVSGYDGRPDDDPTHRTEGWYAALADRDAGGTRIDRGTVADREPSYDRDAIRVQAAVPADATTAIRSGDPSDRRAAEVPRADDLRRSERSGSPAGTDGTDGTGRIRYDDHPGPAVPMPAAQRRDDDAGPLNAADGADGALDRRTVSAREREMFGGMKFGCGFFGWLTATGLAVLVLAILGAAGVAFGLADADAVDAAVQETTEMTGTARTISLISAIVLLVILFVAYLCGGYVAGRMARFNGVQQGVAVWLWAILTTAILAGIAAVAGSQYNILAGLNLPRIPVDEGDVTWVGIIAIAAAVLVILLGAILGGKLGTRFHRRVDRAGFEVQDHRTSA